MKGPQAFRSSGQASQISFVPAHSSDKDSSDLILRKRGTNKNLPVMECGREPSELLKPSTAAKDVTPGLIVCAL